MSAMWAQKYAPKSLDEFVNQKEALKIFLDWIKRWQPGAKPLLFHGPPGTGKTALVYAYAKEKKLEFVEMNASDFRTRAEIEKVFGQSVQQAPLFAKGKIFLIDEIDGLAGKEDVGGVGAIIEIVKKSMYPIVLIANNPYDPKLRTLRQYCQLVLFRKIHTSDIRKRLAEICKNEKIKVEQEVLEQIAKNSDGDLRSAINDLESICCGKKQITLKDLEVLAARAREADIFSVLGILFKSESVRQAKGAIANLDKDPEELFWWIENNITREFTDPEEIANAFDALSKADLFRRRVISRQNWRLMAYMIDLMTAGIALAKKSTYKKFTKYTYPEILRILGSTKTERKDEKEKLLELSKQLHCSTAKIRKHFLPFFRIAKIKF